METAQTKRNDGLNDKQTAFCQEYIIDFNATKSAIRAGYSKKTAGAMAGRLLGLVKIQEKIKEMSKQREQRTNVTADRVVQQLAKIAFMDIKDVIDWGIEEQKYLIRTVTDEFGVKTDHYKTEKREFIRPKDPDLVDGTLIQTIKMGKYGFEVSIPDRMRAFEMLAKHLGVFDDRPQTTVDVSAYINALHDRAKQGDLWQGFNNGGPDEGGEDDGNS